MKRILSPMFVLLAAAAVTQTPPQAQGQRSPMAETPNTDIYYKVAPDAIPQGGQS